MDYYPAADFVGLAGNLIIPVEFPSNPGIPPTVSPTTGFNVEMVTASSGVISHFDTTNLNGWNREGSTFVQCVAVMPIVKLDSTTNAAPANASSFIFGLFGAGASFTNPPAGYTINVDGPASCPAGSFQSSGLRGTCILTPPENTLPIDLSNGAVKTSVCELSFPAGWTFSSLSATFQGTAVGGSNSVSAAYTPTGELNANIECIDLTIFPGTSQVNITAKDGPPGTPEVCTPGYWKQSQHFFAYPNPPLPTTLFGSIFNTSGRNLGNPESSSLTFASRTFLQALQLRGGGLNAVARLGTAAYLDSLVLGGNFSLSTATVVSMLNAAFAANNANVLFNGKKVLDTLSTIMNSEDLGLAVCPLGNDSGS
jgi:hypothetical protein